MTPGGATDGYRLLSYVRDGHPAAGALIAGRVHAVDELLRGTDVDTSSVLSLMERWPTADRELSRAAVGLIPESGRGLADVEVLAPILYPRGIFCTGANYWDHIQEMEGTIDRANRPPEPWLFMKTAAHSVVADGHAVRIPPVSRELDWEAELAVVIGTTARDIGADRAAEVIAGYTILNDLSARDLMTRDDRPASMTYDWVGQKCFDGAAPMGPWITPASAIEDCHNLSVRLWVNGVLKQHSNTNQLVHNVYELIDWLTHHITLLPGDVIATGTPSGVGMPRNDFLAPGDVVEIEIEGCGRLTNPIV